MELKFSAYSELQLDAAGDSPPQDAADAEEGQQIISDYPLRPLRPAAVNYLLSAHSCCGFVESYFHDNA
jgi:hypothetical protein